MSVLGTLDSGLSSPDCGCPRRDTRRLAPSPCRTLAVHSGPLTGALALQTRGMVELLARQDGNEAETRRRVERIFETVLGHDPFAHLSREHAVHGVGETTIPARRHTHVLNRRGKGVKSPADVLYATASGVICGNSITPRAK